MTWRGITHSEELGLETIYLETLIAVADRGSVAAAARMQGITATSVSQRLHALETELNTRLVTRVGREIKLTSAGKQVLLTARDIVEDVRALAAAASDATGGSLRGTVSIGAISSVRGRESGVHRVAPG